MPIERAPSRVFSTAVENVQNTRRAQEVGKQTLQNGISQEVIEAVLANGSYRVVGIDRELYTTGDAKGLLAGMVVPVAWRNGEPRAILDHNARRAQFVPPFGGPALPVVEELFLLTGTVWFRDAARVVQIVSALPADFSTVTAVRWGLGSADYFAVLGTGSLNVELVAVYRLNRKTPNTAYAKTATVTATLVRLYNLGSQTSPSGPVFGTFTAVLAEIPGPDTATVSGNIRYNQLVSASIPGHPLSIMQWRATSGYVGIGPTGDLFVSVFLGTDANINNSTNASAFHGAILINATQGTVVARHASSLTYSVFNAVGTLNGTATVTISNSVNEANAGNITGVSFKRENNADLPNNYVLAGPAFANSASDPAPPVLVRTLDVVGQYAQTIAVVASTPGGAGFRQFVFQASRTRCLYAVTDQNFNFTTDLFMRLFSTTPPLVTDIGTQPALVFALVLQGQRTFRQLYCTQADLVYAPNDQVAPYNRQFFVAGANKSATGVTLTQANLRHLTALDRVAALGKVTVAAQVNVILNFESDDLQVLDNRTSLGQFFKPGPL